MDLKDIRVDIVEDRPKGGMWHCGPNACWITATHTPTGCSVRVYSGGRSQHQVRDDAYALLSMAIDSGRGEVPMFMERIAAPTSKARSEDE